MAVIVETPDQLLERLELMGLERVKVLHARDHFEPKTRGLVQGWIDRMEEALKPPAPPEPAAEPDPQILEARRAAQKALVEAKAAHEAAAAARRLSLVAAGLGGAAVVIAILALFAAALN